MVAISQMTSGCLRAASLLELTDLESEPEHPKPAEQSQAHMGKHRVCALLFGCEARLGAWCVRGCLDLRALAPEPGHRQEPRQ